MAGGGTGIGSQLVIRAKEAAQRAKAAQALGVTPPTFSLTRPQGMQSMGNAPMYTPNAVQPVVTPAANPDLNERMYGIAESFLAGLSAQLQGGEQPKGAQTPPVDIVSQVQHNAGIVGQPPGGS